MSGARGRAWPLLLLSEDQAAGGFGYGTATIGTLLAFAGPVQIFVAPARTGISSNPCAAVAAGGGARRPNWRAVCSPWGRAVCLKPEEKHRLPLPRESVTVVPYWLTCHVTAVLNGVSSGPPGLVSSPFALPGDNFPGIESVALLEVLAANTGLRWGRGSQPKIPRGRRRSPNVLGFVGAECCGGWARESGWDPPL